MAGFGAYMAAGAVSGFGEGVVERARQIREDGLLQIRRQWQLEDREQTREWQLEDRDFAARERARARGASAARGEETRDLRRKWELEDEERRRAWALEDREFEAGEAAKDRAARKKPEKPPEISEAGKYRLERSLGDDFGSVDAGKVKVYVEEVERLMKDEGLPEEAAIDSAIKRAEHGTETRTTGTGLFDGPKREVEVPGGFTGRFRPEAPSGFGKPPATPEVPAPPAVPEASLRRTPTDVDETAAIAEARSAIAAGADRGAVISRLESLGVDPAKLDENLGDADIARILEQARTAIAAGADKEAVRQRLASMGIDPKRI